jgi:phage-related minor tail protein
MKLHHRILARFTEWFGSGGGVWQTTIFTLAIVAFELIDTKADPHGLILMGALTVYSAITQPALAFSGAQSNKMLHEVLTNQGNMLANQADILERIHHMLSEDTVIDSRSYDILCRLARSLEYDAKSPGR